MYVNNFDDGHVEVEYIPAHTGHTLSHDELKYLPLPARTKEEVATKLSLGINPPRILHGKKYCVYKLIQLLAHQSMYEHMCM